MEFNTLAVQMKGNVAEVLMNRPEKSNAMNADFWAEMPQAMQWVNEQPDARVAILRGEGKNFSAGIDLNLVMQIGQNFGKEKCPARAREKLLRDITLMQESFSSLENCRVPVIAAIHGACYGGGIDLIAACDMRYASADARFCVKEVDVAMTADIGTLQRLPRIVGEGIARELALTADIVDAERAAEIHLVNRVFDTRETMLAEVQKIADTIASKSPLAIRGTKEVMNYSRDHSVPDSLKYVATWNASMLMSDDITEAMMANMQKKTPTFKNLVA